MFSFKYSMQIFIFRFLLKYFHLLEINHHSYRKGFHSFKSMVHAQCRLLIVSAFPLALLSFQCLIVTDLIPDALCEKKKKLVEII